MASRRQAHPAAPRVAAGSSAARACGAACRSPRPRPPDGRGWGTQWHVQTAASGGWAGLFNASATPVCGPLAAHACTAAVRLPLPAHLPQRCHFGVTSRYRDDTGPHPLAELHCRQAHAACCTQHHDGLACRQRRGGTDSRPACKAEPVLRTMSMEAVVAAAAYTASGASLPPTPTC